MPDEIYDAALMGVADGWIDSGELGDVHRGLSKLGPLGNEASGVLTVIEGEEGHKLVMDGGPNHGLPAGVAGMGGPKRGQDWGHDIIIGINDWGPLALAVAGALDGVGQGADGMCFPAGTLVSTAMGLRAIESVNPGDAVWGYDLVASQWRLCRVRQAFSTYHHGRSVFVTVAGDTVEATFRHPFWVVRGEELEERPRHEHIASVTAGATTPGRWVDAGDLRVGDEMLLRDGGVQRVEALAFGFLETAVYNFDIEGLHTYAVGRSEVLVHNAPNGGPEVYKSFEEGAGVAPGGVDALENIGPTQQPDMSNAGFTEAWTGYLKEHDEWWTGFRNPETGEWAGFHWSSRNDF